MSIRFNRLLAVAALASLLGLSLFLESCTDSCTETYSYTYYEPVFTSLEVVRNSISLSTPQPMEEVGKIYFKDGYLFVNDPGKGIHIIDNRDPANPVQQSFISIPGNYDLAIRNSILFADSYIDLVALDISNLNLVREVSRMKGIFSSYSSLGFYADNTRGVVTDWIERKDVQVNASGCEIQRQPWGGFFFRNGVAFMDAAGFSSKAAISPGNSTGIGGSMARFTIYNDYLYMLDAGSIHTADISLPTVPEKKSSQYLSWDIETIFPYADKLFIGARSGMHIFDLTDPENPNRINTYRHINSCDPVVVENNYAYVTLRSGNECDGFTNQLEVLNLDNLTSPKLVKTYPMHNPHGLGIDKHMLFICDGDAGLKIYNAKDKLAIDKNLLKHYKNIHAYDAIPFDNVLMLIGKEGISQYDYADPANIRKLSQLKLSHGK